MMFSQFEEKISKWAYNAVMRDVNKQTPVKIDDLVRHNLTGFKGHVIGIQFTGWLRPVCRLTVSNRLTNRFMITVDRSEFTHAVGSLIDPIGLLSQATGRS
jgi:hypothetical protein